MLLVLFVFVCINRMYMSSQDICLRYPWMKRVARAWASPVSGQAQTRPVQQLHSQLMDIVSRYFVDMRNEDLLAAKAISDSLQKAHTMRSVIVGIAHLPVICKSLFLTAVSMVMQRHAMVFVYMDILYHELGLPADVASVITSYLVPSDLVDFGTLVAGTRRARRTPEQRELSDNIKQLAVQYIPCMQNALQ